GGPKQAGARIPKQPKDAIPRRPKRLPTLDGPGIIRAEAQAAVATRTDDAVGVLTFPIPGTYGDQIPLTFDLHVDPPAALKSYRWVQRTDQRNWLCEVNLAPKHEGALVRWEGLVLVDRGKSETLPLADKPEVPEEAKPWTRSTACVQSDDQAIRD